MMSEADEVSSPVRYEADRPTLWDFYHRITVRITKSYVNVLLIFVPLGIASVVLGFPAATVFVMNLLATAPLTAWIMFAIGELQGPNIGHVGDELLKATLGNPMEVLAGIIAMSGGQVRIAQRTLIGNVLLYSLPVLGCCLFIVGRDQKQVQLERTTTGIMSSLTIVASISLIIPTIMSTFTPADHNDDFLTPDDSYVLRVSHFAAIVLLVMCIVFFYFRFHSHRNLFRIASAPQLVPGEGGHDSQHNEHEIFVLNRWAAGFILVAAMAAQAACITFMLKNVGDVARTTGISTGFLVTILIPVVGNATKFATIVVIAAKGLINPALRVIIGANLRILLLIMPVLVLAGWVLDLPLTLQFDLFDATILFLAIMVMNYLIQDGKSNYFEGLVLMGTYVVIAVAFGVRPMPPDGVIYL